MEILLHNIDQQLQDQTDLKRTQDENLEGIDEYLNKDIFEPEQSTTSPCSPPIPIPIELPTKQMNFPFTLQFVFPADNVPPFHFQTQFKISIWKKRYKCKNQ